MEAERTILPMKTAKFPSRRHVVTASLSIRDIQPLVADLRREMAATLRAFASRQESPELVAALREVADIFESIEGPSPRDQPAPEPPPKVRPIRKRR